MSLIRTFAAALLVPLLVVPAYNQQLPPNPSTVQTLSGELEDILRRSEQAERGGQYEDAIAGFEAVLALDKADTNPSFRAEATAGLVRAKTELRKKHDGLLGAFRGLMANYLLLLLIVMASLFAFRVILRFFPRKGTVVSFSDANASSDNATASSRSLTTELLILLEDPEPVAIGGLQMNTMPGTDQPAFGVVRPAQAMRPALDFSASKLPMKLAGVEFGLDDAVRFVGRFFERPQEETLVGWLSSGEYSAVAEAELTRGGFRTGSSKKCRMWRAVATGENARDEVLADIAAQILVDTRENRFTDSWQSLKACQDGIRAMRRAEGGFFDSGRAARRCFEAALAHDSANWIARFNLALSLCTEGSGKPATALRHFQILDDVLSRAVSDPAFQERAALEHSDRQYQAEGNRIRRFFVDLRAAAKAYLPGQRDGDSLQQNPRLTGLLEHMVRYPECPFILQYNIAIALEELRSNSGDQEFQPPLGTDVTWTDPLESLKAIVALRDRKTPSSGKYAPCEELLQERERLELALYAQSARSRIVSIRNAAGAVRELVEILKSIDVTCEDVRCLNKRIDNWRALQTTRAVALASLARALAAEKELSANQQARNLLYEAIASEPHLVEAYLQLAELYMRWGEAFAKDWAARAESLLTRAADMNPTCKTTKTLLSELSAMPAARPPASKEASA